jgi:transposase
VTTGDHLDLKIGNPSAEAIDIGSTMHMAAVNPDMTDMPVRALGTFTQDLQGLAEWFQSCGLTSMTLEFTGFSWIDARDGLVTVASTKDRPRIAVRRRAAQSGVYPS